MDPIKSGLEMPIRRWKRLLAVFGLFALMAMGIELFYGLPALERDEEGELGVSMEDAGQLGQRRFVILEIKPWSRILEFGAAPGDLIVADRWYDLWRSQRVGEVIGLTLFKGVEARHIAVPMATRPVEPLDTLGYLLNALLCTTGIVFGCVVGLRQADKPTSRALALAFIWWSINVYPRFTPPGIGQVAGQFINAAALLPGWYFALWFAIQYPDQAPSGLRAQFQRAMPAYLLACAVGAGLCVYIGLGHQEWWAYGATTAFVGVTGLSILVAFWDGWRQSQGALRQRFLWLLGSFSLFVIPSYISWLAQLFRWPMVPVMLSSVIGSLLMYIGLAYAVLRHRVLDVGLAVNRSLTIALVGAVLIGTFQALQFAVGHVLHFEDPTKAGLLSAVLAATVLLAFGRVKPWADKLVDHVFFSAWVAREEALRRFVDTAAHFTQVQALCAAFVAEVDRFTTAAGCTIYLRTIEQGFERVESTGLDVPARVDGDDAVVVALRAGRKAARCDEVHSYLPGEVAFPLAARGGRAGFLLLGPRPDGSSLRADEIEVLCDAALRVGAELQALLLESLGREVAALRQASATASEAAVAGRL